MTIIRVPYQKVRGVFQPLIPIGLNLDNNWKRVEVYVDSGAHCTILKSEIADRAGFNYRTGDRITLQVGSGGLIPVYVHPLEVQLGTERFTCPVGFSHLLGVNFNVLGKSGIFDRFKVCFQQQQRSVSFELQE